MTGIKHAWPLLVFLLAPLLLTASYDPREHARLYTSPDPAAAGGIEGRIDTPGEPIRQVLAIPPAHPERVYRGKVSGSGKTNFSFAGLPMGRYDLLVIYDKAIYEGLQLMRGESTLTTVDLEQIEDIIQRSEPFFNLKTIHRVEGQTGRGSDARAICTFARDKPAEMYTGPVRRTGMRRTNKLVLLRQVGPGWQVKRTRDLFPVWADKKEDLGLRHHYNVALSGIRVTDHVRDLGALNL